MTSLDTEKVCVSLCVFLRVASIFRVLIFCYSSSGQQDQPGGPGRKRESGLLGGEGHSAQGQCKNTVLVKKDGSPVTLSVCLCVQEGANINKSLTTLGKVISALAESVGQYQVTNVMWERERSS